MIDVNPEITGGHIYHPLRNEAFNRLFLKMRSRFKGINIPMKETLRFIMTQKRLHKKLLLDSLPIRDRSGIPFIIGLILWEGALRFLQERRQ